MVRLPTVGSSEYPGLANIVTTVTLSTLADSAVLNTATPSAASAAGTVAIDWSNTSISVQVTNVGGQTFTQDFATASLNTITIGGVPFTGTLAPVPRGDGSFAGLLTTQVGLGANSFDHTVLGRWTYQATIPATVDTVGFFVAGTETRQQDLPTSGTANYSGRLLANLYEATVGTSTVVGNATGSANFATDTFTFATTGSTRDGIADSTLDVNGSLTRPAGIPASNVWTGNLDTTDPTRGLSGSINGRCYGPACTEFGGTFFMNAAGQQMIGGILLKQ